MENAKNYSIPPPLPELGDAFSHGWETMKKYFVELLLIVIISIVIGAPMMIFNAAAEHMGPAIFLIILFIIGYMIFLRIPIEYGIKYVYLKAVRGETIEIKDILKAFDNFINVLAASILVGFVVGLGMVMLIIPGIIFACKLAFVPYLVMDKKMDAVAAFKKSWEMTNGHALTIFLMGVISFFLAIFGLILLIVGIIPVSIWISSAFAALYYAVDARENGYVNGNGSTEINEVAE